MRDYVNLLGNYAIDLLEETFTSVGHYNEAVREFIELVHQRQLIRTWLAQHGVQRRYHWHVDVPQKPPKMAAGRAPRDAKIGLDPDAPPPFGVGGIGPAREQTEFLF